MSEREKLAGLLGKFSFVEKVFESDANFLLLKVNNATALYQYLASQQIVVRNRSSEPGCANCLRVTIGTPEQNELLIKAFNNYEQ